MSPDDSPVGDSESLLRLVPSDEAKFHFPDGPVDYRAFLPSLEDDDGLSLFREFVPGTDTGFLTATGLRAAAPNPRVREFGGVAAVPAGDVRGIPPLTVEPKPDDLPGHVVIKEINRRDYDQTKQRKRQIKEWADQIVRAKGFNVPIKPTPIPPAASPAG